MANESPFSQDDLVSLGKKLAALDLTEPERAALAQLLSDDDVSGFGRRFDVGAGIRLGLRPPSLREHGHLGIRKDQFKNDPGMGDGPTKPGRF